MIALKINNGEKRTLKDEFIDITLNDLSKAYDLVYKQLPVIKNYLIDGKEIVNESDLNQFFEFQLKWVAMFSDFTIEELRLIPMEETDSLSVSWLYSKCKLFMGQPPTAIDLKEFKHKGVNYKIIEPVRTISGAVMLFGNANYRQWMIGSQLSTMIEEHKSGKGIEALKQLFALLYTDGNDSSEAVVKRAKIFGEVNALYGWSAFFFFAMLVEKYKDFFHSSMTTNMVDKIQTAIQLERLKIKLSKTFIGRSLLSKFLNVEFSILENKAL